MAKFGNMRLNMFGDQGCHIEGKLLVELLSEKNMPILFVRSVDGV